MNDFRDMAKEEMCKIPFLKGCMNLSMIFWAAGTVLVVLGQFIVYANFICADLFSGLGFWIMWFGILLAFVKKEEYGLMIPFGVVSITHLIMFIIFLAHHALSLSSIIHFFCYGGLCFLAFKHSTLKKRIENNRAQSMTNAQNVQGGYICPNCGSVMAPEAQFCTVCGTEKAAPKFCAGCGRPLNPQDRFCPGCGKPQ